LILEGVLRFRGIGLESRRKPYIIFFLLLFLFVSYINRDYPTNRYLTHDSISIILLSLGAYYMLYRTRKVESIVHLFTAAAFVFMAMGFAYRWYLAASGAIETVAVGSTHHPFQVVLFLMGIPWTLGWTYGFGLAMTFRSRQQLTAMANQDALTGLDNRRCLNNCIKHMLIGGKIKEQQFLLILIDINGFKIINDTFGHNFGDEVLITTAETIREAIRENDFAIRFGGDEFIVLMHFLESSEIEPLVKRLRDSLETVRNLPSMSLQLRVSIGTAIYPDDGDSIDKLLQVADIRMYNEKNENKLLSKVTFFSNQTANNC
jgi:diguanylate cyclase